MEIILNTRVSRQSRGLCRGKKCVIFFVDLSHKYLLSFSHKSFTSYRTSMYWLLTLIIGKDGNSLTDLGRKYCLLDLV